MANYFGIDFGTTNSAVVVIPEIEEERYDEIKIGEDKRPLPSFVAINKETGAVSTGRMAKVELSGTEEYYLFPSIKTIIGEDMSWKIAGKTWTPVDIAAELFKSLKSNALTRTDMDMDRAVVAVPIGFSSKKKNALRRAAKLAGITITMFISEPTSAYCSRIQEMQRYKNVAVFDWGGGTLDVVILQVENGIIRELATCGMSSAGDDIDRKIAEKVCLKAAKKRGMDYTFEDLDPKYRQRLLNACERTKCDLADEDIAIVSLARLDEDGKLGRIRQEITYDYFSLLIENNVENAISCLEKAMRDAGLNAESLDCVLCEGGSSRLRPLQERLESIFDRDQLIFPRTAMWDIASGAAEIACHPGCYTLSRPIGIMLSNDQFYPLMQVGQKLPTIEKTETFSTTDSDEEAKFIFTDSDDPGKQSFSELFPVPVRGFIDEVLKVTCFVDADMVFKAKISSNKTRDGWFRVWTYPNLKLSFRPDVN